MYHHSNPVGHSIGSFEDSLDRLYGAPVVEGCVFRNIDTSRHRLQVEQNLSKVGLPVCKSIPGGLNHASEMREEHRRAFDDQPPRSAIP